MRLRGTRAGLLLVLVASQGWSEDRGQADPREWRFWGASPGGVRYSPLADINRRNVTSLETAWTYDTGEIALGRGEPGFKAGFTTTPLLVGGVLYLSTPSSRVIALDPETGKELWVFDPQAGKPVREWNAHRGVSYWESRVRSGKPCDRRIVFGTVDSRLMAIDAVTGKACAGFGRGGAVDLRAEDGNRFREEASFGSRITAPPAIYKDLVITGRALQESPGRGPNGDVRAYDVRTGRPVWRFHTVPRPGEPGHDTWPEDGWQDRSGTNVWSVMSVDPESGLVLLPLGSPASDFYGGDRKGANLFGNSLVALDAATGRRRWHFQMVHHDLWDYDVPAQPVLVTVKRNGKSIPAVAQVTKMGFVYVLDRRTGTPLFEVEERPVPRSQVPGEWTSPTQPFPRKPAPLARTSITRAELSKVTPESARACEALFDDATNGSIFTPLGLGKGIFFPGLHGGGHWGGGAYDPTSGLLYVGANEVGAFGYIRKTKEGSPLPYGLSGVLDDIWFSDPHGWPCQQPPWGTLSAIDVSTGEYAWKVPLGQVDELVAQGLPRTGRQNLGGAIVTAGGLVFIGATVDERFRAFDAKTGEELWSVRVPASAHANPMTYRGRDGRQYVVIAAGAGGFWRKLSAHIADTLVAFALPKAAPP
jgi:membrane-bound PQQ-dependent dehydrogenase (glucose/quinate/shikimate family)